MKMLKNLFLAGLALAAVNAKAQTADDIIAKNTDAMGGAAKVASLNSVKMSGNISAQGMDIPLTITKANLKGMRVDLDIMGSNNYQIITPDKGYMFFPVQQMSEPKELDADMLKSAQNQLDIQGPLYNYKDKGETIEYSGMEKVDGNDAYKLKVTSKTGNVYYYFVDAKTNRLSKVSGKAKGTDGNETDITTTFGDWKQNADGYWFPYSMTTMNGPMTFDKIETNMKIDDGVFKN